MTTNQDKLREYEFSVQDNGDNEYIMWRRKGTEPWYGIYQHDDAGYHPSLRNMAHYLNTRPEPTDADKAAALAAFDSWLGSEFIALGKLYQSVYTQTGVPVHVIKTIRACLLQGVPENRVWLLWTSDPKMSIDATLLEVCTTKDEAIEQDRIHGGDNFIREWIAAAPKHKGA